MKRIILKNTLVATLFLVALTGTAFAGKQNPAAPEGFETVKTRQLDGAWVNPDFQPGYYNTIVIRWGDFDYKPSKDYRGLGQTINGNFEMPNWAKAKLQSNAYKEFAQHLGNVDDYTVIDIEDANHRTLAVDLELTDIVNYVPDTMQLAGRYKVYTKDFGAMTLGVEFTDLTTGELQFKGQVRDHIEAHGMDFQRAMPMIATHYTKRKLNRWARGLQDGLDNMK